MIKGENYSNQLYENWSNRLAINTFLGNRSGVIENFEDGLEVTTSGAVATVGAGVAIVKGGIIRNTTDLELSVQLEANTYHIVVIEVDLSKVNTNDSFAQATIKIISQADSYPTLTQQDIELTPSTGIYQLELARFQTSTTEITNPTDTRQYISYALDASNVGFDNTSTGLAATNLQDAIDEVSGYLGQLDEI